MFRRSQLSPRTCYLLVVGSGLIATSALSVADGGDGMGWTDVTPTPMRGGRTRGAAWGDYDKDGDLDLYITQWAQPNSLHRNDGNDTFTEVTTVALTPTGEYYSGRAVWADIDNDGDLDLFVCQSRDSHLLRNNGLAGFGDFTNGEPLLNNGKLTRTASWGDYDQDGFIDLYISTLGWSDHNRLLRNLGDGTFDQMSSSGPVENEGIGRGTSFTDYDNDGDLDIYVVNGDSPDGTPHLPDQRTNGLYRNDGGIFTDVTTPPVDSTKHGRGVTWGDFDNDGDLDLYLASIYVTVGACCYDDFMCVVTSNYACVNYHLGEYGGHATGCDEIPCNPSGACCLPDGSCQEIDLSDCTNAGGIFQGDFTICAEASCAQPESTGACCITATSCAELTENECLGFGGTYEGDGTLCISSSCPNSGETGACCISTTCTDTTEANCIVLGGIYRGNSSACGEVMCTEPLRSLEAPRAANLGPLTDGLLDLPDDSDVVRDDITYDGENQLFRNDGNGAFTDISIGDLGHAGHTRCSSWVDFDNDMDLDLLLVNAYESVMLLRNDGVDGNGDPLFVDVATEPFIFGIANSNSASWADYDGDGDMDVFICLSEDPGFDGDNRLLRNDLDNGNHWLEVECVGTVSNRSAIGARLTVTTGGIEQIREIESGSGYFAAHMLTAHFGLGPNESIDTLHVRFPNGREVTLNDVPADQKITVVEPCDIALGECDDCDLNGVSDIQDIATGTATDCNFNNVLDTCDFALGTSLDCNLNGIPDECEVADPSQDCNANGIPDSCEPLDPLDDCNGNGIADPCDIASGSSDDANENGVPDECDLSPCIADIDDSGTVDIADFSVILVEWGCTVECSADLNGDGVVDIVDFSGFLILFGEACEEEPFRDATVGPIRNGRSGNARSSR